MKNIKIGPDSYVELVAKDGVSVADALKEAIELCKSEGLNDCTLNYEGFLFDIEPDYCVDDKVKEYNDYLKYKEAQNVQG
jgi:hypothetical protein